MIDKLRCACPCRTSTIANIADSVTFHGLLLTVLGSKAISIVVEAQGPLRVCHQHWQFWPILARLLVYYSVFWGPGVISTIDKPRCACTCRSSTFANFVESDPFHGQLLTVLGSKAISIVVEPQGALRVFQQHWQSWPIQARLGDYYSMFWGP